MLPRRTRHYNEFFLVKEAHQILLKDVSSSTPWCTVIFSLLPSIASCIGGLGDVLQRSDADHVCYC